MGRYIVALDQGTTSSRAILLDSDKNILGISQKDIRQIYPKEGFIEHDPEELYTSIIEVMKEVVEKAGIDISDIAGIGIANQRETTIVFDKKTGKAVYNAIVWQCRRTSEICQRIKENGLTDYIRENTGLVIDPYFSATKIVWILENVQGAKEMAEKGELGFSTVDSWLLYKLTGGSVHKTDMTNASRTMLYNVKDLKWDDFLCGKLGIPESMLPEVTESSDIFGYYDYDGHNIPIAGMAGDQQAALFGQGCITVGDVKNTYGTGCFLLVNTGEKFIDSKSGLISTIGLSYGGTVSYAIEGSVFMGGALFKWLRDGLGIFSHNEEIEALARSVESSLGVVVVPAFTGLGAPYWDMNARGTIFGLTRGVDRRHLLRGAIEAVALQVDDLLQAIRDDVDFSFNGLKVDGGASVNDLLLELQSGLSGLQVMRPSCVESTALGAYYLAGLEVGFWENVDELFGNVIDGDVFSFEMSKEDKCELIDNWKKAVHATRVYAGSN